MILSITFMPFFSQHRLLAFSLSLFSIHAPLTRIWGCSLGMERVEMKEEEEEEEMPMRLLYYYIHYIHSEPNICPEPLLLVTLLSY